MSGMTYRGVEIRRPRPRLVHRMIPTRSTWISCGAVLVLLIVWDLAARAYNTPGLFPTVPNTFETLWHEFTAGDFLRAISQTVWRIVIGFLTGSLVGAILGLAMGSIPIVRRSLEPYVHFFRFVTPVAWVAPAAVWVGVGAPSVVFLIIYATLFLVVVNTMDGVVHVHRDRLRMVRCFGGSHRQAMTGVIVPSSIPFILAGMRVGMSNSFATAIGVEMLTGTFGIGNEVYRAHSFYRGDVMFAGIIVIGVLGYLLNRIFSIAHDRGLRRYLFNG